LRLDGNRANASACVGKQPIMVATASTEHPVGCCFIQTQRTQRKRLRLDGNRASVFNMPENILEYAFRGRNSMGQGIK